MPGVVPTDIIIAVDTSGSMAFESAAVQENLNAFSQQIVDSGVDVRVVLIGQPLCIDAPLGSGNCPDDDNSPLFNHVPVTVNSTDALEIIVGQYDQYAQFLRPEAAKQILVVTDDNASTFPGPPDMWFHENFVGLNPTLANFVLHGIVCETQCPEAATVGSWYIALADQTGGIIGDLCLQDFQPVFDVISQSVVTNSIACSYALPEVGSGPQDADTAAVSIELGEGPILVTPVATPADCADVEHGWFFDDPLAPTLVIFCPETCQQLKEDKDASIEIGLTCSTASR